MKFKSEQFHSGMENDRVQQTVAYYSTRDMYYTTCIIFYTGIIIVVINKLVMVNILRQASWGQRPDPIEDCGSGFRALTHLYLILPV